MDRTIGAIVTGLIVGHVCLLVLEAIGGWIFPPLPPSPDLGFKELVDMPTIYPATFWMEAIMAWAIGSFIGAWTAGSIARQAKSLHGLVVGFVMFFAGIWRLLGDAAPFWFWIVGLGCLIPFAWLGGNFAEKPGGA